MVAIEKLSASIWKMPIFGKVYKKGIVLEPNRLEPRSSLKPVCNYAKVLVDLNPE